MLKLSCPFHENKTNYLQWHLCNMSFANLQDHPVNIFIDVLCILGHIECAVPLTQLKKWKLIDQVTSHSHSQSYIIIKLFQGKITFTMIMIIQHLKHNLQYTSIDSKVCSGIFQSLNVHQGSVFGVGVLMGSGCPHCS